MCLIIYVLFWRPFTPKSELNEAIKGFVHIRVGHGIFMVGFHFENEGPVWLVVGVNSFLRGCGCACARAPPHACARARLTKPSQGEAWLL